MVLGQHKRAVGVFPRRHDAEHALHELRDSGFPMDRVSVVVRDADRSQPPRPTNVEAGACTGFNQPDAW